MQKKVARIIFSYGRVWIKHVFDEMVICTAVRVSAGPVNPPFDCVNNTGRDNNESNNPLVGIMCLIY